MKLKHFFYSFLLTFNFLNIAAFKLKGKVSETEEIKDSSEQTSNTEKKLIVEVEPADYENDFIDNLRDQEDVDRRFGMDDLGMIIEKVTQNRYYPYPPTQPISGSQSMLPNLIGSPYLGPYTTNQAQRSSPRFKEKLLHPSSNKESLETNQLTENNEFIVRNNEENFNKDKEKENDSSKNYKFKEEILSNNNEITEKKNEDNEILKKAKNNNQTALEKIEENIIRTKLKAAIKTLNDLNENASKLLISPEEENPNKNYNNTIG